MIVLGYCRWITRITVLVVEPDSGRKERAAESILHTERVDQSVAEALRRRQGVLQGVRLAQM